MEGFKLTDTSVVLRGRWGQLCRVGLSSRVEDTGRSEEHVIPVLTAQCLMVSLLWHSLTFQIQSGH